MNRKGYENLLERIEKLRTLSLEAPVIVEGKKDESALRAIGVKGKIFRISSGMPLFKFCEDISERYSSVIILTDLDKEGERLFKKLRNYLVQMGVKINETFRKDILSKLETYEVESIYTRLTRINEQKDINMGFNEIGVYSSD